MSTIDEIPETAISLIPSLSPKQALLAAQEVAQACLVLDEVLAPGATQRALSGLHELLVECLAAVGRDAKH